MANLRDIRRRIKSVRNTGQITKAMKMVSAAKLRGAEEAMMRSRPYSSTIERVIASLAKRTSPKSHILLSEREEKTIKVLVVVADRGLCGAFNTNLLRSAFKFIKTKQKEGRIVKVDLVGKKGKDFFKRREIEIEKLWLNLTSKPEYEKAKEVAEYELKLFKENSFDSLYLVYNEFKTLISQKITYKRLIPVPVAEAESAFEEKFIYEPSEEEILNSLLERQISFSIYQSFLESFASEQGARMAAMENATKSAKEMIEKLTLHANRVRQAGITKELIEIVSGAQALS
ncbi:MAG: ATP synthase F1 subunit gamma [Acidobacteria bacterium]|nr:ATP synthase F1 subunit gamma [Acidobacteriota bacterium]